MYFYGKQDGPRPDDYRPQVHDSDGLLLNRHDGWLWRNLTNPQLPMKSSFDAAGLRGFGLLQRDRTFSHYQDLEARYDLRPGYWVEPRDDWSDGTVKLLELPTPNEVNDNIVAFWRPPGPLEAGKSVHYSYRIISLGQHQELHALGRVVGSRAGKSPPNPDRLVVSRSIVDFQGEMLEPFYRDPEALTADISVENGRLIAHRVRYNAHGSAIRVIMDFGGAPGEVVNVNLRLLDRNKVVSETWSRKLKVLAR